MTSTRRTIISLGSNAAGTWGAPNQTLDRAIEILQRNYRTALTLSGRYATKAVGRVGGGDFLNQVATFRTPVAPAQMLRFFKKLERLAGRRVGTSRRWGARALDIDLIDCGGRRLNWRPPLVAGRPGRAPMSLVLPHPHAHLRAFVLPLVLEAAPDWHHPALRCSGRRLLGHLPVAARRGLLRTDQGLIGQPRRAING